MSLNKYKYKVEILEQNKKGKWIIFNTFKDVFSAREVSENTKIAVSNVSKIKVNNSVEYFKGKRLGWIQHFRITKTYNGPYNI